MWLLAWIGLLSVGVYGREFFITKNQSDLVFDGHYLTELSNDGKEFWICVDYEAEGMIYPDNYGNKYPLMKCGGSPRTENNMFWYAVHGIWTDENKLSIRFKSKFQLWPEHNDTSPAGSFFWAWHQASDSDNGFRVIQTHGITNYGQKRPDIDTLLLSGHGSVHVRGVKDGGKIHVRVKGEQESGITLEKVFESTFDPKRNEYTNTDGLTNSEENVTDLPLYNESETMLPETKPTEEDEVVTSAPTEWRVVDSEPATQTQEDEPMLLIRVPEFNEGVQRRPTQNIPFVEPVYDRSSEENRRSQQLDNFENEINEEDPTTIVPTIQSTESSTKDDDTNSLEHLYEPLVDVQDSSQESNIQLLYTVLIGTALGFFCFFVLIVLFRCFAWNETDKVNSYSPQTQQKHVVYTIGGMGSVPFKVTTQ